ncbi:glycoside hydrolase family 2 protein [Hymenobacter guriensis]|uniref:Glycoside hydrolase family 2 n=1 Tax=Hymenobacter guriensis TaxID=2793065 RepID=A0ABS0L004_9BACT|nr:sugar-binding domain-containing protein [Hymenobacter guriensis]MBG8553450.1 glycoside hydrolase family 2 [Hymenobacter guriensis]
MATTSSRCCNAWWRSVGLLACWGLLVPAYAQQSKLNHGLTAPQDPATLPRSRAAATMPVRKAKVPARTVLTPVAEGEFQLNQGWELASANDVAAPGAKISRPGLSTGSWYNAMVPGTVLTTLVEQGVYPDPFFGLNNLAIPDTLSRQAWWYRLRFRVPEGQRGRSAWLVFDGINYAADIWLNGHRLGFMKGAFRRGRFDATKLLRANGENVLAVRVLPPPHPGRPHEESARSGQGPNGGMLATDGPTFIASEGWDWMPGIRDRNTGLWQPVRLRFSGPVTLLDPQVITDLPLPDTTRAELTVRATLYNATRRPQRVTVSGQLEGSSFSRQVTVPAGASQEVTFRAADFEALRLTRPRLWWPNGYGRPALYTLPLTVVEANGTTSDAQSVRFGVRELTYEMTVDMPTKTGQRVEFNPLRAPAGQLLFDNVNRRQVEPGVYVARLRPGADQTVLLPVPQPAAAPYLVLKVNGQRIFCRGGNWGMDDALKRVSRARLEPYFQLHQQAGLNMIRNWTGESTEEDFYALADEYGQLIWNDFWLSTEGYNLEPTDNALFLANARDVVRRFRNHPSIALWCPRNEGYAPVALEDSLAQLIATDDGTRYYQPNSRNLNLRPSGPWHYFHDPADYFRQNGQGFTTEIGTFSVPGAAAIRQFLAPQDQWPITDAWYYHDLHVEHEQEVYLADVARRYGPPVSLDDFTRKVQLLNYDSHRAIFEAWNSRLWHNTSGVLLWMSHPAWPSMIWQLYSSDYSTHGAYYGAQKACEPVHIQQNLDDGQVVIVNTTLKPLQHALVQYARYDAQGRQLSTETRAVALVPANQLTAVLTPAPLASLPPVYLTRLRLLNAQGQVVSENEYWQHAAGADFQVFNTLPAAQLQTRMLPATSDTHTLTCEISNPGTVPAVAVTLSLQNTQGQPVLPVTYSAGYFTLLPGERKIVTLQVKDSPPLLGLQLRAEAYNH